MRVCVLTEGTAQENENLPDCDLLIIGFQGLGEVDYESELKGKTEIFENLARFSKQHDCSIISGCKTNSRGLIRKSLAVCERGKLVGISDMNCVMDKQEFKSGAGLGLYVLGGYKVGLIVENDLLFPENFQSLALCGCNVIVCALENATDSMPANLIRTYAYVFGVPVVMCAGKVAYFADVTGEIATSFQGANVFENSPKNEYHLITVRRRGVYCRQEQDY